MAMLATTKRTRSMVWKVIPASLAVHLLLIRFLREVAAANSTSGELCQLATYLYRDFHFFIPHRCSW